MEGETVGTIAKIWRYPVKSLGGESLAAAPLVPGDGIAGDRAHVLCAVADGLVAQASRPKDWPGILETAAAYENGSSGPIRYTLPDRGVVSSSEPAAAGRLAQAMGRPVALIESASVGRIKDGDVHLLTTASLTALTARRPDSRFEARRFRPNLLIEAPDGAEGFVENGWVGRRLGIGDAVLRVSHRTVRCVLTTLAQGDLPKDPRILRSAVEDNGGDVGVYAAVETPGTVRVGDALVLLEAGA